MKIHRSLGLCIALMLCLAAGAAAQDGQNPVASVTVLLMTTDIQVAADGSDTKIQHIEMRAGNDAGAQQIGQISLAFDSSAQDLAIVEAHTLKADGKTLAVDTSAIYEQAPPEQTALIVTGLRAKLIVFPQFAAGDTAVYTIKTTTRHPNFPGQFFYAELFPRTGAFNEVRETITAPKSFPLYVESHDVEAGKRDDGANVTYSWHYAAPKPLAELPVTFSPLEHTPRFFASSFKDYAQMGRAYAALAEPRRLVTPKIKALADEITTGTSDPKGQAQKLYEWVNSHIRYVGIELGTGSFVPRDVDTIVITGYGDCKDHDILLQVLLKARGIDSQSILLNGGGIYSLTDVPTFTTLDHVITFVPQFNLYLDSSAGLAPFGILPVQEYGKPMVVASTTSAAQGKMPVLAPGMAKITLKTVAVLDKNGEVTGTSTTTASGPYAINLRLLGLQIQAAGPTAAARLLTASGYENAGGTFTQEAPTGFSPDYTISGTFKWTGWADYLTGKNSFFMPPGLRLLGLSGDGIMGPFDPGTMDPGEPTVCFSAEQSEDLSLKAPAGFQFNGLPNDLQIKTPNLLFVAHWSLAGDTLSVHRDFTSNIAEQFCSGAIRSETAAALKTISESYNASIYLTPPEAAASRSLYETGEAHFNSGQYDLAVADYTKIIEQTPNDVRALYNRGTALGRAGKNDQAIADLSKAIELNAPGADPYLNRGLAELNTRQFTVAIADFDKAISLRPDNGSQYRFRGKAHFAVQQFSLAIADFAKAVAIAPDDFDAYEGLAVAHTASKQYASAIADLTKALSLRPENVECLDARGYAHLQAREYQQAIKDYDAVIAQRPNLSSAYLYRGDAKNKLGHKTEGERDIATAVKLDPSLNK